MKQRRGIFAEQAKVTGMAVFDDFDVCKYRTSAPVFHGVESIWSCQTNHPTNNAGRLVLFLKITLV
jgi:hypothetical protein